MMRIIVILAIAPLLMGCVSASPIAAKMSRPGGALDAAFDSQTQDRLYLGVIEGLIQQKRYQAAIAFLDQYPSDSPRAQILRGNAQVGAGYWRDAILTYERLTQTVYAAQAYNGIGRAESARANWAAAAEAFRRASAIEPANADYLNNLGYARLRHGGKEHLAAAADNLKRAYELSPGSAVIRNNLILAAQLSNDSTGMAALLSTIKDAAQREEVRAFAANWPEKAGRGLGRNGDAP